MHLATVFKISIFGLMGLASGMLAFAEGAAIPVGLTIPLVVLAFFFTEHWKPLQLSVLWANVFGVVAFLFAGLEFFSNNLEARLLSGAHLIVYLSWIVLFQRKSVRLYWWMSALAVLQVAVGSVLTDSGVYGALLVLFLVFGVWTLSLLTLYQALQSVTGEEFVGVHPETMEQTLVAAYRESLASKRSPSAQRSTVAYLFQPSLARGTVQRDPDEKWIGLRFATGVFWTACLGLFISSLFFLFVPRIWMGRQSYRYGSSGRGVAVSGFAEQVTLGEFGEILESTEPVLEMRLVDNETEEELDVQEYAVRLGYDEPLFRGTVLETYRRGRWEMGHVGLYNWANLARRGVPDTGVRQEIILEPIGSDKLFALHPVSAVRIGESGDAVMLHRSTSIIVWKNREVPKQPLSYTMYAPLNPDDTLGSRTAFPALLREGDRLRHLQLPETGLEELSNEARRVSGASTTQGRPTDAAIAERLVRYLRDSGKFSYSLDMSIQDATADPVEDFLFNRKAGHCEYFASSLTLMLRAAGVPARLVSGFKGGTVNTFTGKFEVEQRHAHAWVEAYIDGRWKVLDATPAEARTESVESMASNLSSLHDLQSSLSDLWRNRILKFDSGEQRQVLYLPLKEFAADIWASVARGNSPQKILDAIKAFVSSPKRWFSWQGGVFTFFLLLIVSGLGWLLRRVMPLLLRRWSDWKNQRGIHRTRIEFYERFRKICATKGLRRQASQTQREFAEQVRRRLDEILSAAGLPTLPMELADLFYRVRFGNIPLDDAQAVEVDRHLRQLEQCLKDSGQRPR